LAKAYDETIGLPAFRHIRRAFEKLARDMISVFVVMRSIDSPRPTLEIYHNRA